MRLLLCQHYDLSTSVPVHRNISNIRFCTLMALDPVGGSLESTSCKAYFRTSVLGTSTSHFTPIMWEIRPIHLNGWLTTSYSDDLLLSYLLIADISTGFPPPWRYRYRHVQNPEGSVYSSSCIILDLAGSLTCFVPPALMVKTTFA
ncbi:unnamed protein product [Somion occarium]|uniref:Uncharacterized protein n=1 Tax=Somion occarium TaxID=3059160 RepID=A0ABP1DUV8_9APHY